MFCRSIGLRVRESGEVTRASRGSRWLGFNFHQSRSSPVSASWSPAAPILRCSSVKTNSTSLPFTSSNSKIRLIEAPLSDGGAGQNGKISGNRLVQGWRFCSTHLSFKNVWTQGHGSFRKTKWWRQLSGSFTHILLGTETFLQGSRKNEKRRKQVSKVKNTECDRGVQCFLVPLSDDILMKSLQTWQTRTN